MLFHAQWNGALHLAFLAIDLKNDVVVMPAVNFIAS